MVWLKSKEERKLSDGSLNLRVHHDLEFGLKSRNQLDYDAIKNSTYKISAATPWFFKNRVLHVLQQVELNFYSMNAKIVNKVFCNLYLALLVFFFPEQIALLS